MSLLVLMVASLLSAGAAPTLAAAGPVTHTWPSTGCASTLQACIQAANEDDTVQIATDTPVDERLSWQNKGITLEPAPGFTPTITKGLAFEVTGGSRYLRVARIRFEGSVDLILSGGTGHVIQLERLDIRSGIAGPNNAALSASVSVPAQIEITRGSLAATTAQADGAKLYATNASGLVKFRIVGTRVSGRGNSESGGGIAISAAGPGGSVDIDVYNTVIHDVARCNCGGASGFRVFAGSTATVRLRAVGLTIDRARSYAFGLEEQIGSGGKVSAYLFNSIFSRTVGQAVALSLQHPADVTFKAGRNAYHDNSRPNTLDGKSLGSGNLFVSPGYVDASTGDLRLRSSSPLIDKGQVCSPGGVADPDADGNHRLAGRSVDIGAYERGGGPANGKVWVGGPDRDARTGTAGRDIFCGRGGNDQFFGMGGRDHIDGGPGPDWLDGGPGADVMFGGGGTDLMCARDGRDGDRVDGGAANDWFDADPGDTRISVETRLRPCAD